MERVTMRDVARTAEVSVNTVSRALAGKPDVSPEPRAKVLAVAQGLGYRPNRLARGLRSNKTEIIGDIANPFFSAVVQGISKEAKSFGYSLILQDIGEDYDDEEEAVNITWCVNKEVSSGDIASGRGQVGEWLVDEEREGIR
jgi:LacI family transcriptional regulator